MSTEARFLRLLDAFFKSFPNKIFLPSNLYPQCSYFRPKTLIKDMTSEFKFGRAENNTGLKIRNW
jgi:hypothetical protein